MAGAYPVDSEIPAGLDGMNPVDATAVAKETAIKAELELGEAFITANKGHLWEHPQARPYLEARMALACLLERSGKLKEAVPHFEALLRFTTLDPQGARYHLARCYACLGDTKALQSLLRAFDTDPSPAWTWMHLLVQHRTGQLKTATKTLALARRRNPHIEGYLTGKVRMPKSAPREESLESPEAAVAAMAHLGPAWSADREAMYWLLKAAKRS